MLKAVTRQASLVDAKIAAINSINSSENRAKISTAYFFDHYATKEDVDVVVSEEDFVSAERELVPSVSEGELEHYGTVRAMFEKVGDEGKGGGKEGVNGGINGQGKGKGKGKDRTVDRKGKGKAILPEDDEGEDGYGVEYEFKGKGKGKGRAVDGEGEDD